MSSADMPAIFINSESGSMDAIHADKEYSESGTMTVLDGFGDTSYKNPIKK